MNAIKMNAKQLLTLAAAAEDFVAVGMPGRGGDRDDQRERIMAAATAARDLVGDYNPAVPDGEQGFPEGK